jgi:hypothetical protein
MGSRAGNQTRARVLAWLRRRDPEDLALGLPLAIAAVYLTRLAQTFQDRLTLLGGDSDAIAPLFIAATMDDVPDGDVHLGTLGNYIAVWYARATEWLPLHRELWQAIPAALWIASVAIVVWAAWRTVGKRPAVLTGVVGLCISPLLLYTLLTSSFHPWTLHSSAIAMGVVVFLALQTRMSARAVVVAVAAALALGAELASDRLVLLGSIGPLVLAGAGVAIRHPTRQGRMVGLIAGAVAVGALAISVGVTQIMEASGFFVKPRTEGWIDAHLFFSMAASFLDEALRMFNANFFGRPVTIESTLSFVTAIGVVVALAAPFIVLRRRVRQSQPGDTPQQLGRSAYIFFWAAAMAVVPLGAVASDQNVVAGARYVLPVLLGAAATVPLLPRSVTARYLVIAGVSVYAALGVLNLDMRGESPVRIRTAPTPPIGFDADDNLESSAGRIAIQANQLVSIADEEQAYIGYADYWEAASSSWSTKLRVKVFPIQYDCQRSDDVLCPHTFFVDGGWYVPRPGIRTFLIGPTPADDASYEPPASLGPPLSTHRLLSGARVYVYPYDIASKFPPFHLEPGEDI